MSIYKPCDIRGETSELSPDLYRGWGRSLGRKLEPGALFVVGGDVRESTPPFLEALTDGLSQAGATVLSLGIVPTPMVYFARRAHGCAGCAIVTASHSPPDINGLKWMVGDFPPSEEEVRTLEREVAMTTDGLAARPTGTIDAVEVLGEYQTWLEDRWASPHRGVGSVVIDPGNGTWAGRAVPVLGRVFPDVRFTAIHDHPDGLFSERNPDCAKPEYLSRLAETVVGERADLGIAFDGDGDRVAFVDDEGQPLTAEQATLILLQSFGKGLRDQPFVYDLKFSGCVPDAAEEAGARPVVERSGHAFIRTRVLQTGAAFGAEISGHYFYGELEGGDDGLFTACRMITHLGQAQTPFSKLRGQCPPVFITPDLRLAAEGRDREEAVKEVQGTFADLPQTSVDGVRIEFPNGWALLRSSVTEAKLTFRFEGRTQDDLDRIVREFCDRVPDLGNELHRLYEEQCASKEG